VVSPTQVNEFRFGWFKDRQYDALNPDLLPPGGFTGTLTVNGVRCTFPADLSPGSWLEFDGTGDARLYASKGEPIGQVTPQGQPLALRPGLNTFGFSCAPASSPPPRARVTIFSRGETL